MIKNKFEKALIANIIMTLLMCLTLVPILFSIGDDFFEKLLIGFILIGLLFLTSSMVLSAIAIFDKLFSHKTVLIMGLLVLIASLLGVIVYGFSTYLADELYEDFLFNYIVLAFSIGTLILTSYFYYQKYEELTEPE